MKTSVVLAAYNGEKFISEQLESIRIQTVPVDEVIIVDDQSTDQTVNICQQFIAQYQLANWRVEINEFNLRTVKSFWNAFPKATGDIIFMADQDDIWKRDRVETFLKYFSLKKDALSIASTFTRFNETIIIDKKVKHPFYKKNNIKKITVAEFCKFPYYLGMSVAFKKDLLLKVHSKFNGMPHEIFINFFATINDGFYFLDKVLTLRRSYPQSVSNSDFKRMAEKHFQGDKYLMQNNYHYKILSYFINMIAHESTFISNFELKNKTINSFQKLQKIRIEYLSDRNLKILFKNIFKFSILNKTLIKDFIYITKQWKQLQ